MKLKCPNESCTIERCPHRLEHERSDYPSLPKHCRSAVCVSTLKQVEMFQAPAPARSLKSILEDELQRLGMGVRL